MQYDLPVINDLTQKRVDWLLQHFCDTPGDRNTGGIYEQETGYADTRNSIYEAQHLFCAYLYPDFPTHYANPSLLAKLRLHMDFLRRRQRSDGTVGLSTTGVGSANEVGFTLPGACESYRRLKNSLLPGTAELAAGLAEYIRRGADAVRTYFPFTSNHRWTAGAGPLAIVDSLFPDPHNAACIEEYLSDGIDIDRDGMFHEERSPNYNMVGEWGLLYLADYANRPDLLDLVARNLEFCLAMRQPNGEAETLFSHRQDRGSRGALWGDYYVFKRLAIEKKNGAFAQAADQLLIQMAATGMVSGSLIPLRYLFDDHRLVEDSVEREPLPEHFTIRFQDTPLWRMRNGQIAATVVADPGGHYFDITQGSWGGLVRSDLFLSYHVGHAAIDAVKIRWGSGTGGFRPEEISYGTSGEMTLFYDDPGWDHVAHYRPRGKWGPRHINVDQRAKVTITPDHTGALSLHIQIGGWVDMPVAIELLLREDCTLTLPDQTQIALERNGRTITAGAGDFVLTASDGSSILISGLPASEHKLTPGDSRTIPSQADQRCHRLIVDLFTPCDLVVRLGPEQHIQS